jgi:RND family efflux transporter MFP subunit
MTQEAATPTATHAETASAWSGRRVLSAGALLTMLLAGGLIGGILPRLEQRQRLDAAATSAATAAPRVSVAVVRQGAAQTEWVLPGSTQALNEAALFARTTGYVKTRLVDYGDRVEEGQLLAVIAAPDVDDQLAQARANLAQAQANLKLAEANFDLARITLERDQRSGPGTGISLQQIDQDRALVETTLAQVGAAKAAIQVNEAAVQRYTDLQSFQKIVAPFPGVITARHFDAGDLVTADNPGAGKELFRLMRTDKLRVLVNVPQVYAAGVQVGQKATVFQRDDPARKFAGTVTRTADALDPATRTLLTEVQVDNPDNVLRPGMYLQVKFTLDRASVPVVIPAAALTTRSAGPRVGVLDQYNRVHYRAVQTGRDYGLEIEVIAGLQVGERVVVRPGDDLADGTAVQPVAQK